MAAMSTLMNRCATHGLSSIFMHHDLRRGQSQGLWPSLQMVRNPQALETAIRKLMAGLVADSYGGVRALSWARILYNSRPVRE